MNEPSRNSYYAKRFENIEITCHYTGGKPKPVITWQLNGTDLSLSEIRSKNAKGSNSGLSKLNKTVNSNGSKYLLDHNILIIKNVSKYDSGVYTCLLTNGYHLQQSLNFTLIVQGKEATSVQITTNTASTYRLTAKHSFQSFYS